MPTVAADIKPARPAVSTTLSCFVEWSFVGLFVLGVGTSAWPSAASTSSSLAILCLAVLKQSSQPFRLQGLSNELCSNA